MLLASKPNFAKNSGWPFCFTIGHKHLLKSS